MVRRAARIRPLVAAIPAVAASLVLLAPPALAEETGTTPLPGGVAVEPTSPSVRPLAKGVGPSFEAQVVEIVNQERLANGGLPPLKHETLLDNSSETHSSNMATRNFFAHCDLDTGDDPFDRMVDAGYFFNFAGENIAAGQGTPASVMASWMASSGHRANILQIGFREIGVGYFFQAGDQGNIRRDTVPATGDCVADSFNHGPFLHYWTQNFGRRNGVYPVVIDREAFSTDSATVDLYVYGTGVADEMRIRNVPGTFTSWMPFQTDFAWVLSGGDGTKTVEVELRSGGTTFSSAMDSIVLESADLIFADGFESGDTSAWSATVP